MNPTDYLTPKETRERFPGRPTIRQLYRWMNEGVGPRKTKLAYLMRGGRRFIHVDSIAQFLVERNQPADATKTAAVPVAHRIVTRAYQRRQDRAAATLAKYGIGVDGRGRRAAK